MRERRRKASFRRRWGGGRVYAEARESRVWGTGGPEAGVEGEVRESRV